MKHKLNSPATAALNDWHTADRVDQGHDTGADNAEPHDATNMFLTLQKLGGIQGLLAPALASFYEENGTDFSNSIIAARWNIVKSGGGLNEALTLPELIEYVMYAYLNANHQLRLSNSSRPFSGVILRTEVLRQLLLKVDEYLCVEGWLEKFTNSNDLEKQFVVL